MGAISASPGKLNRAPAAQALQRQLVLAQVDALRLLELVHEELHDRMVEVLATQARIAVCGLHLEDLSCESRRRRLFRPSWLPQPIDASVFTI